MNSECGSDKNLHTQTPPSHLSLFATRQLKALFLSPTPPYKSFSTLLLARLSFDLTPQLSTCTQQPDLQ
jgi:hypothetical protein